MKCPLNRSFAPLISPSARVLILGSFPGEESLLRGEYYANRQNGFWKILSAVVGCPVPETYLGRKKMLLENHVGLWDVIYSCRRRNSSDAHISDITPNDIAGILRKYPRIAMVLLNGRKAEQVFLKHFSDASAVPHVCLPSTSPAHASLSFAQKLKLWRGHMTNALKIQ